MNPDFRDLLAEFNAQRVDFIIVGAHAVAAHGHVRATNDFDVWIRPDAVNASRVLRALGAFGAPLHGLSVTDLSQPGLIFQIGVPPLRIDILTAIDGVEFEDAWPARVPMSFAGQPATVLSRDHLIKNKRASARSQDLADIERLLDSGP
ncbi:MAG: hypothetical protein HOP29_07360 [Phycisphaerales bacterium]|nr:hypothetical protein [Phycisphaerales bacterium]